MPPARREIGPHRHHGRPGSRQIDLHRGHRQHGRGAAPQAGGAGHRPFVGAQRRLDSRRQNPHGEHLQQPFGLREALALGGIARRSGPKDSRDDRAVRGRGIRRHLHRNGGRRTVGNRRALDGGPLHAIADFRCGRRTARHQARHHGDGRPDGHHQGRRREHTQGRTGTDPVPGGLEAFPRTRIGMAAQGLHLVGGGPDGAGGGLERRGGVPRPHSEKRLFPAQPQPAEQILDVRVDQRGAARKFLPRPGRGGVHRSVRETRAGGQNLVVHRRQGVAGDLFQGRPDAGMTRVTVRRAGCRQVDMPIIQPL